MGPEQTPSEAESFASRLRVLLGEPDWSIPPTVASHARLTILSPATEKPSEDDQAGRQTEGEQTGASQARAEQSGVDHTAGRAGKSQAGAGPAETATTGQTEAAVLVPIVLSDGRPRIIFTKRHPSLRHHAGEISFPGGRRDPSDATLLETALREAEEEVAIRREDVVIAGTLPATSTFVTNYVIRPFVATVTPSGRWHASPLEVEQILELPLRELSAARSGTRLTRHGVTFETDAYTLDGQLIWGATARILDSLIGRLGPLL